jgi:hypothetical protein
MDPVGGNTNIRVVIRVRPLSADLQSSSAVPSWTCTEQTITHHLPSGLPASTFQFDRVYDQTFSETRLIFDQVAKDLVDGALAGISGTVFAYGQTSAGKTFTMQGPSSNPGIIPLGLKYFYEKLERVREGEEGRAVTVRLSYMEVYNEVIGDLLQKDNQNLKIHETIEKGIFVGNLSEPVVETWQEAMDFVKKGEEVRKCGRTNMNEYSSRSHTLLRLHIESRPLNSPPGVVTGTLSSVLCFVDLAGSERSGQMGNEGQRLKEGGHINKSLLSLTSVISKLAELSSFQCNAQQQQQLLNHIPYRDSKLTRILQPALTGNTRCVIICAVSPHPQFIDETLSTLKFASRAKAIKTKLLASPNHVITEEDIVRCYKEQVDSLKGELGGLRKRAASFEDGLEVIKRARRDEWVFLREYLSKLLDGVAIFKGTISETSFIFEHIAKDSAAIISQCQVSVNQALLEGNENLAFLAKEKAALESYSSAEIEGLKAELCCANNQLEALRLEEQKLTLTVLLSFSIC